MTDIKATVFIPTYYGEDNLDELFGALQRQKVDFEYEILVIDTSSKDRTLDIIRSWASKFRHFRYETITKAEFSHGRVRQQAAEKARGEYVVYLTQDATPAHDRWLYEIIQPLERFPQVVGVMASRIPVPRRSRYSKRKSSAPSANSARTSARRCSTKTNSSTRNSSSISSRSTRT